MGISEEKKIDLNVLYNALDNMQDSLVLVNLNTQSVEYVNEAFTHLTGYFAEDVVGRKNFDFVTNKCYPEEEDTIGMPLGKYLKGINEVVRAERADGTYYWANVRTFAIPLKQSTHLGILSRDITDVYEARESVRENERLYKAVFNNSFGFIILCDDEGVVIECNEELARKYAPKNYNEHLGRKLWDLFLFQANKEHRQELKSAFLGEVAKLGRTTRFEISCLLGVNDGSQATVDLSFKPVRNEDTGEILFVVVEGRDITERLHYEKELEIAKQQYDKVLGELQNTAVGENRPKEKVNPVSYGSTSSNTNLLERVLRVEANTASVTGDIKKLRYAVFEDPETSLLVIRGNMNDVVQKLTDVESNFVKVLDSYATTRQVLDGVKKVFGGISKIPVKWILIFIVILQSFVTIPNYVWPFVQEFPGIEELED